MNVLRLSQTIESINIGKLGTQVDGSRATLLPRLKEIGMTFQDGVMAWADGSKFSGKIRGIINEDSFVWECVDGALQKSTINRIINGEPTEIVKKYRAKKGNEYIAKSVAQQVETFINGKPARNMYVAKTKFLGLDLRLMGRCEYDELGEASAKSYMDFVGNKKSKRLYGLILDRIANNRRISIGHIGSIPASETQILKRMNQPVWSKDDTADLLSRYLRLQAVCQNFFKGLK